MSIPLVQEATKDAINTSIIAIKRNIERINMLLGLSNSEEIDTSVFATKEELQALEPVDEVAIDNMHSVTSNAVASSLSYSTTEVKTGGKSSDGKDIYKKTFVYENVALSTNGTTLQSNFPIAYDKVVKYEGVAIRNSPSALSIPLQPYISTTNLVVIQQISSSTFQKVFVTLYYVKS